MQKEQKIENYFVSSPQNQKSKKKEKRDITNYYSSQHSAQPILPMQKGQKFGNGDCRKPLLPTDPSLPTPPT